MPSPLLGILHTDLGMRRLMARGWARGAVAIPEAVGAGFTASAGGCLYLPLAAAGNVVI